MGHSAGRAADKNWGNTGAPGDEAPNGTLRTCVNCHNNSAAIQVLLNIDLMDADGNSVATTGYLPGETYTLNVTIDAPVGTPEAYGFQILCLNGEEDELAPEVSNYSNPSANAQIAFATNTERTYVEQNGPSSTNEFTVDWTAPADLEGPITFYSCGNGVNGNGMTSGDGAACNTLTINQGVNSSSNDFFKQLDFSAFPNPTNEYINIDVTTRTEEMLDLRVINILGKTILQQQISSNAIHQLNLAQLTAGSYWIQLSGDTYTGVQKILKF